MPQLLESDVHTKEVLDWEGVHLFHFMGSSCSQKTRIFLNLKGIYWESHHVDVPAHENYGERYMGINPRGLVPALIHDGRVIIESNDILEYLEQSFPEPSLIPTGLEQTAHDLLAQEDDLHLDLRVLSMRYVFGPGAGKRSSETLNQYQTSGSGTVLGQRDAHKDVELKFFQDLVANDGITDDQVRASAARFSSAFNTLEVGLQKSDYLLGDALSVLDIAWYIYGARLRDAGYPIAAEHPKVGAWFAGLDARPEFNREVQAPPPLVAAREAMQAEQFKHGQSLAQLAGLHVA